MQTDTPPRKYVIKFFSEMMVKGSGAKRMMIDRLMQNLTLLLERIDPSIALRRYNDKIEITPSQRDKKVFEILCSTPGIEWVHEAVRFDGIDSIDQIKKHTLEIFKEKLCDKYFVVRAKRSGTHPFRSCDIERQVGGYLLAHSKALGVNLHTPEEVVRLELIDKSLYLFTRSAKGIGGFPLGTQGEALSLLSGGFDSSASTYLSMRRGVVTHFLFFNLGGDVHEAAVKQIAYFLWEKYSSSHTLKFITVPFEEVVDAMFRTVSHSYLGVMLKVLMLQAAEKIADLYGIDALITGESVAQVSSQTLRNLALIDRATSKLVLRPLGMSDKHDIIALCDKIGTKRFAEQIPEFCGVISKNPVIHASPKRFEKEIARFDDRLIQHAVSHAQIINIDQVDNHMPQEGIESIQSSQAQGVVIDIRPTPAPLPFEHNLEVIHIPFFKLLKSFQTLPKNRTYLLYCDKGILSTLQAHYLKSHYGKTYEVKVLRP